MKTNITKLVFTGLFGFIALALSVTSVDAATYVVDDDGTADFTTIQSAIDASVNGDIITVNGGTYNENILIDKSITLEGTYNQVHLIEIAPDTGNYAIEITADGVTVNNLWLYERSVQDFNESTYIGSNAINTVTTANIYINASNVTLQEIVSFQAEGSSLIINGSNNTVIASIFDLAGESNVIITGGAGNTLYGNAFGAYNILNTGAANVIDNSGQSNNWNAIPTVDMQLNVFSVRYALESNFNGTVPVGNIYADFITVDDGSGVGDHAIQGDYIGDTAIYNQNGVLDEYPIAADITVPTINSTNITVNFDPNNSEVATFEVNGQDNEGEIKILVDIMNSEGTLSAFELIRFPGSSLTNPNGTYQIEWNGTGCADPTFSGGGGGIYDFDHSDRPWLFMYACNSADTVLPYGVYDYFVTVFDAEGNASETVTGTIELKEAVAEQPAPNPAPNPQEPETPTDPADEPTESPVEATETSKWTKETDLQLVTSETDIIKKGDFNGDGFEDIMIGSIPVELDTPITTAQVPSVTWQVRYGNVNGLGEPITLDTEFGEEIDKFFIADFNGDGKDDLLVATVRADFEKNIEGELAWYLLIGGNESLTDGGVINTSFGLSTDNFYVGDFDGDGKDDVLVSTTRYDYNKEVENDLAWYLMVSNSSSFEDGGRINDSFGLNTDNFYVGNFNNDNKVDILVSTTRMNFDGDVISPDLAWYFMSNNGINYSDGGLWNSSYGLSSDITVIVDVDKDGVDDMIVITNRVTANANTLYVTKSTGSNLEDNGIWQEVFAEGILIEDVQVGEFTKGQLPDIIFIDGGNNWYMMSE